MNRFTVMLTHTHRDIMDDKEKIDKALESINKMIAENEEEAIGWRKAELFTKSIIYSKQNEELEKIKEILEK